MKYSVFEQAAIEASAGMKEIDAEIQRLTTTRDLLENLVHQLLTVLPMIAEAKTAEGSSRTGTTAEALTTDPSSYADSGQEGQSPSGRQEEWAAFSAAGAAADAPAAEQRPFADLLSQGKPYSLRNEGWPSGSRTEQRGIRELL